MFVTMHNLEMLEALSNVVLVDTNDFTFLKLTCTSSDDVLCNLIISACSLIQKQLLYLGYGCIMRQEMLHYAQTKLRGEWRWGTSQRFWRHRVVQDGKIDPDDIRGLQPVPRHEARRPDEWIVVADSIDWVAVAERYMAFFPSRRGRLALSTRIDHTAQGET